MSTDVRSPFERDAAHGAAISPSASMACVTDRIAVVHDWLDTWRGGENVLSEILRIFPQADLFSLVDFLPDPLRVHLGGRIATTSFLQHMPLARSRFRQYLPLMPLAVESLDLSRYDLILSSSHAFAKGVRREPGQFHLCYCYTPIRYAWDLSEQYLAVSGLSAGLRGHLIRRVLRGIQQWDRGTSERVDSFIAISEHIRDRIARCYGRPAEVIPPPVDVAFFHPDPYGPPPSRREFFVTASRWVPYKRVDAIVAAFRELPDRRLIVVGDGPEAPRVRAAAGNNVSFRGEVPRSELRALLRAARAFVFAAEEDFGILPVEAQASGTPVIAYGKGGALETVCGQPVSGRTGVFFSEQTPAAIAAAIRDFDEICTEFEAGACVRNAARFDASRFARDFSDCVATKWRGRVEAGV